jgi:hypothetical protein
MMPGHWRSGGRFSGEVRVEHYRGAEIVDQYSTDDAIWELMYFGHARA